METDTELLDRFVRLGDDAAFGRLVDRHVGWVRQVAWRRSGDWGEAEEAAQNVFLLLARKSSALAGESLPGWLHRAAVYEAGNLSRKTARYRQSLHRFGEGQVSSSSSEPSHSAADLQANVDEALIGVSAKVRRLLELRYFERLSIDEVAAVTGQSSAACRKCLDRTLRRLSARGRRHQASRLLPFSLPRARRTRSDAVGASPPQASAGGSFTPIFPRPELFILMKASTVLKTAVVTLALAAIPMAFLWRENHRLQASLRSGTGGSAIDPTPSVPPRPAGGLTSSGLDPLRAASPPSLRTMDETAPAVDGERLQKLKAKAREKAQRIAHRELTRLAVNLPDLTVDQKEQILKVLEEKEIRATDEMLRAFSSGAVFRSLNNPGALTAADQEALAAVAHMQPHQWTPAAVDTELQEILAPDQFQRFEETREWRRIGAAEDTATDVLKFLGRSFDLQPEQKDALFQELAQQELARTDTSEPDRDAAPAAGPLREYDRAREARDRVIRTHLTPEQLAVFDQNRAMEKQEVERQMMEFYHPPAPVR